jgi:stage IV sporulation protein A
MTNTSIYQDIASRTGGNIYIGVVGPVRTGKSTFIKRFMETQVLPGIDDPYRRERAQDELPQSGSGRTVMTAEPKFIPEEAVQLHLEGDAHCAVRLIDCVGYLVDGAIGQYEEETPRMVMTPWYDHEIPMTDAAEIGTRKVITDHSTVGIVVTTDGSVTDFQRQAYAESEERVIRELQEIGKPFVVLINSAHPEGESTKALAAELSTRYQVKCIPVNCLTMSDADSEGIINSILREFPLQELDIFLPAWVDTLPGSHPIKASLYQRVLAGAKDLHHIRELKPVVEALGQGENISRSELTGINLGTGIATVTMELPRSLFYTTLQDVSGFNIVNDGDLMRLLQELSVVKKEYDKVSGALKEARETGYGIVVPGVDELQLEDPEIVKQGGRYGVKMKASAPSIHMIRADIETTVSPIVGNEKQSEEMVNYLMQEFEGDTSKIWQSNIFGRSFHEIVSEDLQTKLKHMPEDAREKLQETLERIINEGSGGLICIIL